MGTLLTVGCPEWKSLENADSLRQHKDQQDNLFPSTRANKSMRIPAHPTLNRYLHTQFRIESSPKRLLAFTQYTSLLNVLGRTLNSEARDFGLPKLTLSGTRIRD